MRKGALTLQCYAINADVALQTDIRCVSSVWVFLTDDSTRDSGRYHNKPVRHCWTCACYANVRRIRHAVWAESLVYFHNFLINVGFNNHKCLVDGRIH